MAMWPPPVGGTITGGATWLGAGTVWAQADAPSDSHAVRHRPKARNPRSTDIPIRFRTINSKISPCRKACAVTLYISLFVALLRQSGGRGEECSASVVK